MKLAEHTYVRHRLGRETQIGSQGAIRVERGFAGGGETPLLQGLRGLRISGGAAAADGFWAGFWAALRAQITQGFWAAFPLGGRAYPGGFYVRT